MNKYYEVIAKCGHVGRGKYIEISFYVKAENGKEAAELVRAFPRVKRDHRMAISGVRQIAATEYVEGRKRNNSNPYLLAGNIQEQREFCPELTVISGDWRMTREYSKIPRAEKKTPLKIKDPWKYRKYNGFEEERSGYDAQ